LALHHSERNEKRKLSTVLRTIVEGKHYDFLAAYYQKGHCQEIVFSLLFYQYRNLDVIDKCKAKIFGNPYVCKG
jgi:hypothetical protein